METLTVKIVWPSKNLCGNDIFFPTFRWGIEHEKEVDLK